MPKQNNADNTLCLIIGNSGFLGFALAKKLLDRGCEVLCIDEVAEESKTQIEQFKNNKLFKLLKLKDRKTFPDLSNISPDYIFSFQLLDAFETIDESTTLQEAYRSCPIQLYLEKASKISAKFLLVAVDKLAEQSESYLLEKGVNKEIFWQVQQDIESLVPRYIKRTNLNARIVRIADPIGTGIRQNTTNPAVNMIRNAIQNNLIILPDDGLFEIYPTHSSDIAEGLIKAMFSQSSAGKMYAVINNKSQTLLDIAYIIRNLLANQIQIKFMPSNRERGGGLSQAMINSQQSLSWQAEKDEKQAIAETIDWLLKILPNHKLDDNDQKESFKALDFSQTQNIFSWKKAENSALPTIKDKKNNPITTSYKPFPFDKAEGKIKTEKLVKQNKLPLTTIQPPVVKFKLSTLFKRSEREAATPQNSHRTILIKIFLVLALPALILLLSRYLYKIASSNLQSNTKTKIAQLKSMETDSNIKGVDKWMDIALFLQPLITKEDQLFNIDNSKNVLLNSNIYKDLDLLHIELRKIQQSSSLVWGMVLGKETIDLSQTQQELKVSIKKALELSSFIEAELNREKNNDEYKRDIEQIKRNIVYWQETVTMLDKLLAFKERKVVAVAIMDSMELRPTGGFLDSILLLTLEKGRLLDAQVKNVYQLDTKLNGVVEPPSEIANIINFRLSEKQWWLRDANMFVDFPLKSAPRIAWFLEKELGFRVDAVWGIDSFFIKNLLFQTGDLFLPEFNENINSINFEEKMFQHANLGLGSDQSDNTSFLQALTFRMVEKIKTMETTKLPTILPFVAKQADLRHFILWDGKNYGQIALETDWSATIKPTPAEVLGFGKLQLTDYLMLAEANLGINKANHFIAKLLNYEISLTENEAALVRAKYQIKNNSQTEAPPAGTYKSQIWLYLPKSADIKKIEITNDKGEIVELDEKDIIIGQEKDKKNISFYMEVPPQAQLSVNLSYLLENEMFGDGSFGFYLQKQVGIDVLPVSIKVNYPSNWKPVRLSEKAVLNDGVLELNKDIDSDLFFAVSFSR